MVVAVLVELGEVESKRPVVFAAVVEEWVKNSLATGVVVV